MYLNIRIYSYVSIHIAIYIHTRDHLYLRNKIVGMLQITRSLNGSMNKIQYNRIEKNGKKSNRLNSVN